MKQIKLLIISINIITIIALFSYNNVSKASIENEANKIEGEIERNEHKVIITDEITNEAERTIAETCDGNYICSTDDDIIKQEPIDENQLEEDGTVEQEDISYDGDIRGNGLHLLGAYQGLTYYSQADSRWANTPYTSIGDSSQTMKSSGCGPTVAAMVVSSSKGAILPTTMANLFVSNGYRTAANRNSLECISFYCRLFWI